MKSLIFDLDGTLWNASNITRDGWNSGFELGGIPNRLTRKNIEDVSGLPHYECIKRLVPLDFHPNMKALEEIFDREEKKLFATKNGELYPFVLEGLSLLAKHFKLAVVSNCQDWYLDAFLKHNNLHSIISDFESHGRTLQPKSENIKLVIKRGSLLSPVYIGDTESDQKASKAAGVPFHFVNYGFGNIQNDPTHSSFEDLVNHFLNSID